MDELAHIWKKMSMTDAKGTNIDLSMDKKKTETVSAVKFFTHRSSHFEVVARTFRPIWHTRSSFEVTDAQNNVLLIAFDLEIYAEKELQGKPWAFERHLIVLQRYNGLTPAQDIVFNATSFLLWTYFMLLVNPLTKRTLLVIW